MYKPRRHLSQTHMINCACFIREKNDLMKMRPVGGGRTLRLPQLNSPLCANMTDEQVEWSSRSLYIFTVK